MKARCTQLLERRCINTILGFLLFACSTHIQAESIYRIPSDDNSWHNAEGWDCNCIPTNMDDVFIEGNLVYIDNQAVAKTVTIQSNNNLYSSELWVLQNGQLTISENLNMTLSNPYETNILFELSGNGTATIGGNLIHTRPLDSNGLGNMMISIKDESVLNILNDLIFNHLAGFSDQSDPELFMRNNAQLDVSGNFNALLTTNGSDLDFLLTDQSILEVGGDMTLVNQSNGYLDLIALQNSEVIIAGAYRMENLNAEMSALSKLLIFNEAKVSIAENALLKSNGFDEVRVDVSGDGQFIASEDIVFEKASSAMINLNFSQESKLSIGGVFDRTIGTANISMTDNAQLVMSGDSPQALPAPFVGDDENGDQFELNKICINNASNVSLESSQNGETSINGLNLLSGKLLLNNSQSLRIVGQSPSALDVQDGGIVLVSESEDGAKDDETENRSADDPFGSLFKWDTGETIGTFVIPLETIDGEKIPVEITNFEPMGEITLSSYATETANNPNNRPLPNEVLDFEVEGIDVSASAVDRFWKIDLEFPDASGQIRMTYTDAELENNPTLDELTLSAFKYSIAQDDWTEIEESTTDDVENQTFFTSSNISGIYTLLSPNSGGAIPVTWFDFNAKVFDQGVQLEWATASEVGSDYFEIQRSNNGSDWTPIGKVQAIGYSNQITTYQFDDDFVRFGKSYYRIKQVDLNASYTYSGIASVFLAEAGHDLTLYPNPITQSRALTLDVSSKLRNARIIIYDDLGRVVFDRYYSEDSSKIIINLDALSIGLYNLLFINNGIKQSKKLAITG